MIALLRLAEDRKTFAGLELAKRSIALIDKSKDSCLKTNTIPVCTKQCSDGKKIKFLFNRSETTSLFVRLTELVEEMRTLFFFSY